MVVDAVHERDKGYNGRSGEDLLTSNRNVGRGVHGPPEEHVHIHLF